MRPFLKHALSKEVAASIQVNPAEAKDAALHALDSDPSFAEARAGLAAALAEMGRLSDAEKEAKEAVHLRPTCVEAHQVLGVLLCLQQRYEEAEKELRLAFLSRPYDPQTLIRLGEVYGSLNAHRRAERLYQRALHYYPYSSSARAHLGFEYASRGDRQRALAELRAADRLSGGGDDINTEQFLSLAYSSLHDLPAAIHHTKAFLSLASEARMSPALIAEFQGKLRDLEARLSPLSVRAKRPSDYSPKDLDAAIRQRLSGRSMDRIVNPLAASPEMQSWAARVTLLATNAVQRAEMLFDALVQHVNTGTGGARTAAEAFEAWRKPDTMLFCQDYAYLYIALARSVGLKAYDVLVEEAADGSKELHACAAVFIDGKALLVDPAYFWFGAPHKSFEVLDDLQSIAVYLAKTGTLKDCEIAAKLDPASSFVQANLALGLMQKGKWDEAHRVLGAYLRLGSDPATSDYLQAQWALHENQVDQAINLLVAAVKANPDFGEAHLLLGFLYQQKGMLREARDCLRKALDSGPGRANEKYVRQAIAQLNEKVGD